MIVSDAFLMIEPKSPVALTPIVDSLTRRVAAAMRKARQSTHAYRGAGRVATRGIHHCTGLGCGVPSDNRDYYIIIGGTEYLTNILAVHYVAYHRHDIPAEQMALVESLPLEEVEPIDIELAPPGTKNSPTLTVYRPNVEASDDDDFPKHEFRPGYR